ncbi:type III PLP-dependent enzyme [Kitasatospora sp. NPDC006697]|uniref:type III PLP-dependent enzyme n=1 Tax=Kitasatospora sp. NPDC006697 TaxID=3364020 RepID=UPI0036A74F31
MTEPATEPVTASPASAGGIPFTALAAEFGTPLYVYDGAVLAQRFGTLRAALHPRLELFFSLKSNPNLSVYAFLHGLGARAEVSSRAELHTAFRAGAGPANTIFLGPGKSAAELADAVSAGIAAIVCESFQELALIDRIAAEQGVAARVALRVNPAFTVKGAGLAMGGVPRQFGIDEAALLDGPADLAARHPHLRLIGVHVYMGTRIMAEEVVVENTARILDLSERLAAHLGFPLELVDVGGGLGVAYFDGETDLDPAVLAEGINPLIAGFAERHPGARLVMELGRYLAADAGTYVAAVRYTKESMGRRFAVADGGTNHHMAAVGIGSLVHRNFPIRLLNRSAAPGEPTGPWQLTGPLCTPVDLFGRNVELPELRPGDLIGIDRSGAYGPSASPTGFLSHGHPAEVLVVDGTAHLVRRRETLEDLMRHQILYTERIEAS